MPVMSGFGALAELPWERVTDKIERRVLAGQQGMIVWWKMKAGAHAAAHDCSSLPSSGLHEALSAPAAGHVRAARATLSVVLAVEQF